MLFSALLFIVQMSFFGSLTGNAINNELSYSGDSHFNMFIRSVDVSDELSAKIRFSSDSQRVISVSYYVIQDGATVSSDIGNISVNGNSEVSEVLPLNQPGGVITFIVYASDGTSDMKIVQTLGSAKLTGNAVKNSAEVESMPLALLTGGVLLLIIIVTSLIVSRHKRHTKRIIIHQEPRKFIRLDFGEDKNV